jgi:hypothetical protein
METAEIIDKMNKKKSADVVFFSQADHFQNTKKKPRSR